MKSRNCGWRWPDFPKAVNGSVSRNDVLDSVANSLEYLSGQREAEIYPRFFGNTVGPDPRHERSPEDSGIWKAVRLARPGRGRPAGMWQSSGVYGRGSEIENSLTEWEAVKADILDALKGVGEQHFILPLRRNG